MDADRTTRELTRADDQFREIIQLHVAARRSIILAASLPDAEALLQGQIQITEHLKRGVGIDAIDAAAGVLDSARREYDEDFYRLRRATLVAMCSAFEYLVKAAYVDQAAVDPAYAERRLESVNVRFRASELEELEATERWYLVADRLFDKLGAQSNSSSRGFGERARRLLVDFVPSDEARTNEINTAFSGARLENLNEAYLVRNCLVHNGGRANAALSATSGKHRGELIVLDRRYGPKLMQAIIDIHGALAAVRL